MQTPSHEDAVPDGLTSRRRQRKETERVGEGSLTLAVVHLEGNHPADDDPQREPAYRKRPDTACCNSRENRSRWELGERRNHAAISDEARNRGGTVSLGIGARTRTRTCLSEGRGSGGARGSDAGHEGRRGAERLASGEGHAHGRGGWSGTAGGDEWITPADGVFMRPFVGLIGADAEASIDRSVEPASRAKPTVLLLHLRGACVARGDATRPAGIFRDG